MSYMTLTADELFFSRVEGHYSRQGRAGYQVVYHTSGISAEDIEVLEERIQCFTGAGVDKRFQFFRTPSGKYVLAVSETLHEIDRDITDRNGRGGAFIAHCYVLSAEEFAKIDYNPFFILCDDPNVVQATGRQFAFELTAPGMIKIQEQDAGAVTLSVNPSMYEPDGYALENWSVEQFHQVVNLAIHAQDVLDQNYSISLRSDSAANLRDFLALIFYTLPPSQRANCSFDTFVDGCTTRPGTLWVLGGEVVVRNARMTRIDVDTAEIDNVIEVGNGGDDPKVKPFLMWLSGFLQNSSLQDMMKILPDIHPIVEAFNNNRHIEKGDSPAWRQAVTSFMQIHHTTIRERFRAVLKKYFPNQENAQKIEQYLTQTGKHALIVNTAFTNELDTVALAEGLYAWLEKEAVDVQWKDIHALAKEAQHIPLESLATLILSEKNGLNDNAKNTLKTLGQRQDVLHVIHAAFAVYQVKPNRLVNEDTAPMIEAYYRHNPQLIRGLSAPEQVTLFRNLGKARKNETIYQNYRNVLAEEALIKLESKPVNRTPMILVGVLIGLVVLLGAIAVIVLGNQGKSDSETEADVTLTVEGEIPADGLPMDEATQLEGMDAPLEVEDPEQQIPADAEKPPEDPSTDTTQTSDGVEVTTNEDGSEQVEPVLEGQSSDGVDATESFQEAENPVGEAMTDIVDEVDSQIIPRIKPQIVIDITHQLSDVLGRFLGTD